MKRFLRLLELHTLLPRQTKTTQCSQNISEVGTRKACNGLLVTNEVRDSDSNRVSYRFLELQRHRQRACTLDAIMRLILLLSRLLANMRHPSHGV